MLELISAARRRKRTPTYSLFDVVSMEFRVGLLDIDLNMHLNNGKYTKIMDRCRLEHAVVTGLLNRMIEARASAVVANSEIAYVRELRPYQRFMVHTRILGWDDKYTYYDQRFDSQRKLPTHALLRLAHMYGGQPTSPHAFQAKTGQNKGSRPPAAPAPPPPGPGCVQQPVIRFQFGHFAQGVVAIHRFATNPVIRQGFQQALNALAGEGFVIGNQYAFAVFGIHGLFRD